MNAATSSSKGLEGFEDTVRDFWVSRPRRPRHGRKVAGVAAGIGNRYGIDPVIVRVVLLAMTILSGIGVLVYLLGWLLLPAEGDRVSALESLIGRGRSSTSKPLTLLLCLLLLPASGWSFSGSGWFDGGGFIGLALVVTAVYLLHRGRGHLNRPEPMTSDSAIHSQVPSFHNPVHSYAHSGVTMPMPDSSQATQVSPGWDPLGAAPLAWDLPGARDETDFEPEPPAPKPPRHKSKIGIATFGLVLIVGGVGAALMATGALSLSLAHLIALLLGIVGVGLVAGAFAGGARGLIWLAAPLAAAGIAFASVDFDGLPAGVGELRHAPHTAAEVRPLYERTAGDIELDLSGIDGDRKIDTRIIAGAGATKVIVPQDADVTYHCGLGTGDMRCFDQTANGVGMSPLAGTDYGADGPGGQQIELMIEAGVGDLEVSRG